MKKALAVLLILTLACSLCACGAAAPAEAPAEAPEPSLGDQMYEKYGSIIDSLEAGDFEAVLEEVTGMMPEPEKTVIEITPENFYDYYELCYPEQMVEKDAEGTPVSVWPGQYFYFQLKEEYAEKLVPDASQVEVGVICDSALRKVEAVDWETGALTLSEETFGKLASKIFENWTQKPNLDFSETFSGNYSLNAGNSGVFGYGAFYTEKNTYGTWWTSGRLMTDSKDTYYVVAPENIELVRAEGSITLRG